MITKEIVYKPIGIVHKPFDEPIIGWLEKRIKKLLMEKD